MFTILIMGVLGTGVLPAEEVTEWRKTYHDLLLKNQEKLEEEQGALEEKYLEVLEQRSKGFQEAGKLEAVLHLRELMEVAQEDGGPGSPLEAEQDPYIPDVRKAYHRAWGQLHKSASEREQDLKNTYLERLQAEIVRKTKSGEIETALAFRKELEEVRALGMAPKIVEVPDGTARETESVQHPMREFENSRYLYVKKAVSWREARDLAERMGGHLWIINSKEEWQAVRGISGVHRVWIGAFEVEPGKRLWLDGTVLTRIKGIRFRFSSHEGSEPAITMGGKGLVSDREERASPGKVRGFIVETPKY